MIQPLASHKQTSKKKKIFETEYHYAVLAGQEFAT